MKSHGLKAGLTAGIVSTFLFACSHGDQQKSAQPRAVPRDQNQEQVVERSYQQPGELGKTEASDAGSAQYQERLKTVRIETKSRSLPTVQVKRTQADINRMNQNDFVALGLSPNVAHNVIKKREDLGKFKSVNDLMSVPGMDQAWFNQNRDRLAATG